MSFATPLAFILIIALAAVAFTYFFKRKKRNASLQFSSLSIIKHVPYGFKARISELPNILKWLALVIAVFALARPQEANQKVKKNVEGIDIMITLDVSDSMLIEDMTPVNRLETAKLNIKEFIKGRISDRIGLVVFSGESYTRMPLTLDYPLLLKSVDEIEISRNLKMGTAIGVALANGIARLKDSTAKSRVLILLTDGENNSGTIAPETALEVAKGFGIKIYTIGIGRDGATQLPVYITDSSGRRMKTYQPFTSTVNDDLLTRLAIETGGKYFRASKGQSLKQVFSEIDKLEKTKVDINRYVKYAELYQGILMYALWLYLIGFILGRTYLRRAP